MVELNSELTVARAHFYLELASELRIPLRIDPVRSEYLSTLQMKTNALVASPADMAVNLLANSQSKLLSPSPFAVSISVPPVAEHVLSIAKATKQSLLEAALAVRNTRNAILFRGWCSDIFLAREEGGIKGNAEVQRLTGELLKTCDEWVQDVRQGTSHQMRRIVLRDIPFGIGKVLSATGLSEFTIPDPILVPSSRYRSIMFLNDLLRSPER